MLILGCNRCFKDRSQIAYGYTTMGNLYTGTMNKLRRLRVAVGSRAKIHIIWEHSWDYKVAHSEEIQSFLETLDLREDMGPRDCYYGGRTEAFVLKYEIKEGERILCYDINSLYPSVLQNGVCWNGGGFANLF